MNDGKMSFSSDFWTLIELQWIVFNHVISEITVSCRSFVLPVSPIEVARPLLQTPIQFAGTVFMIAPFPLGEVRTSLRTFFVVMNKDARQFYLSSDPR